MLGIIARGEKKVRDLGIAKITSIRYHSGRPQEETSEAMLRKCNFFSRRNPNRHFVAYIFVVLGENRRCVWKCVVKYKIIAI